MELYAIGLMKLLWSNACLPTRIMATSIAYLDIYFIVHELLLKTYVRTYYWSFKSHIVESLGERH